MRGKSAGVAVREVGKLRALKSAGGSVLKNRASLLFTTLGDDGADAANCGRPTDPTPSPVNYTQRPAMCTEHRAMVRDVSSIGLLVKLLSDV